MGLEALGDLLGGDGAEEAPAGAGLGVDFHGAALELLGDGLGLGLFRSLAGLFGLFLQLHLVYVVSVSLHSQLAGEQKVAGVAVGDLH